MSLIGTMNSGVSALRTFQKGLEVIGNNIANVNTTSFKSSDAKYADSFSNILQSSSPALSTSGSSTPTMAVGTGVALSGIATNFTQGSLATTGNVTDLGISGGGYFVVKNTADTAKPVYATRVGSFRIDSQGYLVSQQGYRVQGLTGGVVGTAPAALGDIKLGTPAATTQLQSFSIDKSGNLVEFYADGTSATTNQILMQSFNDESALNPIGNGLYSSMGAAGPLTTVSAMAKATNAPGSNGLGQIQSGTLESSNVDLTEQFSDLITTQRSFQAASRLITVSDTVLEDIVGLKTR